MTSFGITTPRLWTRPLVQGEPGPCGCGCSLTPETSMGFAFAEFCELAGKPLFPFQRWLAIHGLEVLPSGLWRYRTVLVLIARQNGKTTLCQLLSLFWMLVQQVPLVLGTSTKLDYARESWEAAVSTAEAAPDLRQMFPVSKTGRIDARRANGEQTLSTLDGCRYKIAAANAEAGRSLTVNRLILDELRQHGSWATWSAATNAGNAVPDFQTWAITNAGSDASVVLNHLREKGLAQIELLAAGKPVDEPIGLFEWSAPENCALDDREAWAQANPALGYGTITERAIQAALETDPEVEFRTEVLCIRVRRLEPEPIPLDVWELRADRRSKVASRPVFTFDVAPDLRSAAVSVVGARADGRAHVEVVAHEPGTSWLPRALQRASRKHPDAVFACLDMPHVVALVPGIKARGVTVQELSKAEHAAGCSALQRAVADDTVRHLGDPILSAALAGAARADVGDGAWVWARRRSDVDISPLIAVTAGLWVHESAPVVEPMVAWR